MRSATLRAVPKRVRDFFSVYLSDQYNALIRHPYTKIFPFLVDKIFTSSFLFVSTSLLSDCIAVFEFVLFSVVLFLMNRIEGILRLPRSFLINFPLSSLTFEYFSLS